ncbi:hypothetical protein A5717_25970 [Mycolicibacterium porcinum]|uniref:hypothetical protein n=1 Tax=Mycolicibacterium porcinum TaxID=39693 RepID=UPI00080BC82C|nr:hypothetical protein [Mycolicibacterium porcinum]OCB09225.1 hypothetical protein A5717_25970 [Mycolicibacterium porcinum]
MSEDPELLKAFEERFAEVEKSGKIPRPEMLGFSRLCRHMHQVEVQVAILNRHLAKSKDPLPEGPKTAYERWLEQRDDEEFDALFGDIFQAAPESLGFSTN